MITWENDRVMFYDVDETLILWNYDKTEENLARAIQVGDCWVLPNRSMIESLKRNKARGHTIIVWTQSGYEWGRTVVEMLQLTEYVDLVISKPTRYYDDLPPDKWIGEWKNSVKYTP
jgi:FMN phosphatase YigB (HAD superfamily)